MQLQAPQGVGVFLGCDLLGAGDQPVLGGAAGEEGEAGRTIGALERAIGQQRLRIVGESADPHLTPDAERPRHAAHQHQPIRIVHPPFRSGGPGGAPCPA